GTGAPPSGRLSRSVLRAIPRETRGNLRAQRACLRVDARCHRTAVGAIQVPQGAGVDGIGRNRAGSNSARVVQARVWQKALAEFESRRLHFSCLISYRYTPRPHPAPLVLDREYDVHGTHASAAIDEVSRHERPSISK